MRTSISPKRLVIHDAVMTNERLAAEWRRLYLLPDERWPDADDAVRNCRLLSAESNVRSLVIEFTRTSDWPVLGSFYESLQTDEELPALAIAVTPSGYQLWLSLANPVSFVEARKFLMHLQAKYLAALPAGRVALLPDTTSGVSELPVIPNFDPEKQKWAAFIDPGMGSMFIDEPGLDIAPNPERQADLLMSVKSISSQMFRRIVDEASDRVAAQPSCTASPIQATAFPSTSFNDPREFLLLVMNSSQVTLSERIAAAKALLVAKATYGADGE